MADRVIYFIQNGDNQLIKIGMSTNLKTRLHNMAYTENTKNLKVLLLLKNFPNSVESKLHNRFAEYKVRDEWFNPGERLLGFVNDVKKNRSETIDFQNSIDVFSEIEEYDCKLYTGTKVKMMREKYPGVPFKYLSPIELEVLFDTAQFDKRVTVILSVLYYTGINVSELVKVEKNDFDFETGTLHVDKGGHKDRYIPIDDKIKDELMDMVRGYGDDQKVFDYHTGTVEKDIRLLGRRAEIGQVVTPKVIRNTFAMHSLLNNGDIMLIKNYLGVKNFNSLQPYFEELHRLKTMKSL